ncbi:hypothetical protein Aperf_G00000050476 [Anoplocephala perfoliata]
MEDQPDYVIYENRQLRQGDCRRFYHLRRNKKFFDLKIVTSDLHRIDAHRVVLATRYPVLEQHLPDEANSILRLDRFSEDIIEVALSYAYTGRIRIDRNNAVRLFLLAINLQCSYMTERCIDFLRTRISRENVVEVWAVANSTLNDELITICKPVIRTHFEDLAINRRFCISMEPEGMAAILADPLIDKCDFDKSNKSDETKEAESLKLLALSTWLNEKNPNETTGERVDRFQNLLSLLDLCALHLDIVISLHATAAVLNVSKVYGDRITTALKQPRHIPASPNTANFSHNMRNSVQENQVLVYGSTNTNDAEYILVNAPQIHAGPEVRYDLPYRNGCSVLRFRRWVCIIGGVQAPPGTALTSAFDILNLDTGRLFRGPEMQKPRHYHSAVGTDKNIFVFGGENSNEMTLYSCETFNCVSNKWTELPNMPTARAASSAVVIPEEGVLVVGGRNHGFANRLTYKKQAEILQSTGDQRWTWSRLPSMLSERTMPGIAYFNGSVFVAGGNVTNHFDIEMMQMPPPVNSKHQWVFVSLMEFPPRHPYSLIAVNERLFLMQAHRVVLATRYPVLEQLLPIPTNNILRLNRFSKDTVESALSYAYAGRVRIYLGNALKIFLPGINLQCSFMTERCIDFLRTRKISSKFGQYPNPHYMDTLREPSHQPAVFCISMEPEGLAVILADPQIERRDFEKTIDVSGAEEERNLKLWTLSTRLHKKNPNETSTERADRLQSLLSFRDICAVAEDIAISLYSTATILIVSKVYRQQQEQ